MKILQIIDSFSFGGAERLLAALNPAAIAQGLDMTVASLAPNSPERSASYGLLAEAGLAPSYIGVRKLLDPRGPGLVRRAITNSGCDVVHAHLGYSATLVPIAARLAGVPCFSTLHHLPTVRPTRAGRAKEWLWTRSAERGAGLIYVSDAARAAAETVVGRPRPTWRVLHNGVDLSAFQPAAGSWRDPLPPELGISDHAPVVTVVAALREPKGHAVALRAWPHVRSRVPSAVLLIVGDGPEAERLRTTAGAGVVFAGSREDVPALLRGSNLALLPSYTEALPTALIEAAACGIPAVATTVGGTAETVRHGTTGLLVPPHDKDALATAVVTLLIDAPMRARYGQSARLFAEDEYDLNRWAARLADLYGEAVSEGPRTRVGARPVTTRRSGRDRG